jgi:hypothetical protein
MGSNPRFDDRTAADFLAEAARFERLAENVHANERLRGKFLSLAADARIRAMLIR